MAALQQAADELCCRAAADQQGVELAEDPHVRRDDIDDARVRLDALAQDRGDRQRTPSPKRHLQAESPHSAADDRPPRQTISAQDVARSKAMTAKLKRCMKHVETIREGFHGVRQEHVVRIERERERERASRLSERELLQDEGQQDGHSRTNETKAWTIGSSMRRNQGAERVFSSKKLTRLKTKKQQQRNTEDGERGGVMAKGSLHEYEENKKFEALPKQEQIKRNVWRRGVSARDLKKYLDDELDQEQACIGLIWAVLMLVFFCMGVFSHMRLEHAHAEDYAVIFDVQENANFAFSGSVPFENGRMGHKDMNDINSIPDFWSWMNLGLVSLLFPTEGAWDTMESRSTAAAMCSSYKEALAGFGGYDDAMLSDTANATGIHGNMNTDSGCPEAEAAQPSWPEGYLGSEGRSGHTYLYYHAIVGGVRMQQEYTQVEPCPDQDFYGRLFSGNCVPGMEPNYMLEPEPAQAFFPYDDQYLNSSMRVFLNSHTSQADLRAQLRELEDKSWLSPHTAKVEIIFATYSPHLNSITVVFMNFFLNRAGHIHKVIEPISFFLTPYDTWVDYLWDALWVLMVVKLAKDEIPEIYSNMREHGGCCVGLKKYMGMGNMVDWLNIVYSCFICFLWYLHITRLEKLNDLLEAADVTVQGSWQTDLERNTFFDDAVGVVEGQYVTRRVISFYPLLVLFKFLKVCSYSPRLALMTETLSKASVDIFHFAVVFFTVFLIYTISGMLLFGQELLMFSSTERALDATFKIVMGDFDWEEMRRIGRLEAFVWFVSFMLLVNLIMLNMLIAIIMDVYAEVKSALPQDADTLWSQMYEVVDRKWAVHYHGSRVGLAKIQKSLRLKDMDEGKAPDEDGGEEVADDLDIVRFIAMAPEDEDGDEMKAIAFNFNFKFDDGTVEFAVDDFSPQLLVKSVSEAGSSCAVRLRDDGAEHDRREDHARFEPCYEGFQVTKVNVAAAQGGFTFKHASSLTTPVVEVTDPQEMLDAIGRAKTDKQSVTITIKKTYEAMEDTHDIEGLVNSLKKISLSSTQARIVLNAAQKHAEEGLNNGSSISENNNRIAKISDILDEVKALAKMNWSLMKSTD